MQHDGSYPVAAVFQWEMVQCSTACKLLTLLSCSAFAREKMVKKEKEEEDEDEEEEKKEEAEARVSGCSHVHQPTLVTHFLSYHLSVLSA